MRYANAWYRRAYFYVWQRERASARELASMTPQDIKAMVAAGREYDDAVKRFRYRD
jgi:hypothetical protein